MKINKVTSSGMQKIIDGYKATLNGYDRMTYGCRAETFFENAEISLFLSDVKGIELIVLRRFCPSMITIDDTTFFKSPEKITTVCLKSSSPKTQDDIKRENELIDLSNKISSLYNFIVKREKDLLDINTLADIGSLRFNVIARFDGVNILSLLDAFPENILFIRKLRDFATEGSSEFDNICGQQFVRNFYSFMEKILSGIDLLTDVRFDEEYFKILRNGKLIECTHIRNPIAELPISEYSSASELISNLQMIKAESSYRQYKINLKNDLSYHFCVDGSMETLLFFLAHTNFVQYYSDLKSITGVSSRYNIPDSLYLDETRVTFTDAVEALDSWRLNALSQLTKEEKAKAENKNITTHYNRLELYNFIPRVARIRFVIHGTESEFLNFFESLESKNSTTPLYKKEVEDILSYIKNELKLINVAWRKIN